MFPNHIKKIVISLSIVFCIFLIYSYHQLNTFFNFPYDERGEIISIGESIPLPLERLVVHRNLPPDLVDKIQKAIIKIKEESTLNITDILDGVERYDIVTHNDFQQVEMMVKKFGLLDN